ncbi:hypothetical protein BLNAU_6035 [Blattamonas nauphoetae]|uniref:Uncharacterized protein n=1 Tax=Blattamonas nauphoetae TaxID=2049346 RepID=A0ABQ9Y5S9_9EUKA|nr:hypothetical protein BLNAU_6035 [Blattamonas nauphoetae]
MHDIVVLGCGTGWMVGVSAFVVLPLVGTSHSTNGIDLGDQMMNTGTVDNTSRQHLSMTGVGLSMNNQHFPIGTGPLFSFNTHYSIENINVDTCLEDSSLASMTSSSHVLPSHQMFGSDVCQRVVGSSVLKSTNHDSGTGMMSPNLGGNVMCLNTSFSSCIRSRNTPVDISFENITQTHIGRVISEYSSVTSESFTLCTFNEMTVDTNFGFGGSAIFHFQTWSPLSVKTCFFHKCSCTGVGDDGGAIEFNCVSNRQFPFSVSDSSFTDCSTADAGGSLIVSYASSTLIDKCFFEKSSASADGAAYIFSELVTISNCAFVDCAAKERSGTITVQGLTTLSLSFSQFRGCSSANDPNAKDLYVFDKDSTQITSKMITFCDSTSGAPNVFFNNGSQSDSALVPQISSTPTIKFVDVSFDGEDATVTIETDEEIHGTMGVLLDGSNVPRLVHVSFGQLSKLSSIGTAVVSSGANGILPSATYAHRRSTLAPFPRPRVDSAESTLKDWNTTEIVLRGAHFDEGLYWTLVEKEGNEWNITLTRSDSTTLMGTAPLHPSTADERLEWATEYEVAKVMWLQLDGQTEEVTLSDTITFTTSDAPIRITSADCSLGGDEQKSALVALTGFKLGGGKDFNVTVRKMEGSMPVGGEIVLSGTLSGASSSTTHTLSVVLFGTANPLLSFGTKYLIVNFAVDGVVSALDADVTFSVPPEPPRITGATCSLNGMNNLAIFELCGSALSSSGQTVVIAGASVEISSSGVIFNVTSTRCFVNFSIGSSENRSHVVFGGRYKVLSVGSESSSFVVKAGLFVDVPHPPRITTITTPNEVNSSCFVLTVSGSNLPSGQSFTIALTSGLSFEISFSSTSSGSSTLEVGGSGEVQYGTEYTIESIIRKEDGKDDEHILFLPTKFTTPLGPTLSSISCDFDSSNPDVVKVTLITSRMPTEDFTLTLKTTHLPTESIPLTITPSDLSSGFVLVEVYNKTNTLKYGREYAVAGMNSSSVIAVVSAKPFSTPDAPIRITSAGCSLGGDKQKSALLTLTGVKLGGEKDFNVTVRKMEGSMPVGGEIVLSGTLSGASSSNTHTLSVVIFGNPNTLLSFGTTYMITKFEVDGEISVVDSDVTFSVDSEPPRITCVISKQLTTDLSRMIVSLEGRVLLSRPGTVSLTDEVMTWESLSNVVLVDDTHCTAEFAVGEEETSDQLKFGETYTLMGSWTESSGFHVEDGITVVVPLPPRITSITPPIEVNSSTFVLSVSGEYLPSGRTFTTTLTSGHSFEIVFSSTSAGSSTIAIGGSEDVQYDTEYTIESIIRKEDGKDDERILFSSTPFRTPLGPTLYTNQCSSTG